MVDKRRVTSVTVDFDPITYALWDAIGKITFFRSPLGSNPYRITPARVARALEAQRLMLVKIEKAGQK